MSEEQPGIDRRGIYISAEAAEAEAIPEELNADQVQDYRFPDPRRRRIGGWVYLGLAAALTVAALAGSEGWWAGAAISLGLSAWHLVSAWPLQIDQEQALLRAGSTVPFTVGHASAAVTFSGIRSRPRWQVIVYAADNPPSRRALVQVDAVTGTTIGEPYVELLNGPS